MEMGATDFAPIPGYLGPENIKNLEDEAEGVVATENTTLYNMGNKFSFLVIIIGKTFYRVNIGDDTWEFFNTDDPWTYEEIVIMSLSKTITGTKTSQLESAHIRKLNNHEQLLVENRAEQELIPSSINSHIITSLFDYAIEYEENYPIKIITFLWDRVCIKFDNRKIETPSQVHHAMEVGQKHRGIFPPSRGSKIN